MNEFNIGEIVKNKNGNWTATVKSKKFDYAYGLCGKSDSKMWLYTLENDGKELLGVWSEFQLVKP